MVTSHQSSHGRHNHNKVAASINDGRLVIEPQRELHMSDKMIQSGLSRLKSVLTGGGGGGGGGGDRERCRHHGAVARSFSHVPRQSEVTRQMVSKVSED